MERSSRTLVRRPAVAGQFYSGTAQGLRSEVGDYVVETAAREKVIALVSPHAGLMYSGHVAGAVYSAIEFPQTFVLLGPNHTGLGSDVSIMKSGRWEIPAASFEIDEALAERVTGTGRIVSDDVQAHVYEHSLELQLPFIAYFSSTVKIVPITVMQISLEMCQAVGESIAAAIRGSGYPAVIAVSSDMSHYVPDTVARRLDGLAIERVLALDPEGLYGTVKRERISMCGVMPATIMLFAARALGASGARLVKYATSAEVSGDYEHVVGYAGITVR